MGIQLEKEVKPTIGRTVVPVSCALFPEQLTWLNGHGTAKRSAVLRGLVNDAMEGGEDEEAQQMSKLVSILEKIEQRARGHYNKMEERISNVEKRLGQLEDRVFDELPKKVASSTLGKLGEIVKEGRWRSWIIGGEKAHQKRMQERGEG